MPKFRKKPVVIEAEKITLGCYDKMVEFFGEEPGKKYGYIMGTHHPSEKVREGMVSDSQVNYFEMFIHTLEGAMTGSFGDWIIKGVNGEFYPCKPEIFEKTYELAE